jgi:hypothetical protein
VKIIFINILFLLLFPANLFSQLMSEDQMNVVRTFCEAFRNNDMEQILDLIHYPIRRSYPLPPVNNREEMRERFDIIFDETLLNEIKNSSIERDWSATWRGIRLGIGRIYLDFDGKLISINYYSRLEREMKDNIISEIKNNLHESLRDFSQPVLYCETENYMIRIDSLNSNYRYRLALWSKINKEQSVIPDLILLNGRWRPDGSGGNHYFIFNDVFQYILYIEVMDTSNYGVFSIYRDTNNSYFENSETQQPLISEWILYIER